MKTVTATIKGTTPMLQHRFTEQSEQDKATRQVIVQRGTPRDEAAKVVYQHADNRFYFPGTWISRCLREVASNHKLKGSRKSAKYVVPAAIVVPEEMIWITNGDGKTPVENFEVDSRPVTIPATKGRIMRHRPRFDCWSATFQIRINDAILPVDFIHELLNQAGVQNGLGDFRPEKGGPFGTFLVTEWNEN